ncbi:MAG TPA: M90 family metallopeptidase [Trichocoleus sp.]
MVPTLVVLLLIGLILAGIVLQPKIQRQRRVRLQRRPFPPLWRALIEENVPLYQHLSPEERQRLQGHLQVFLAEKQFIGCQGLQVTEEMRVIVGAIASLLLLNERGTYFPKLKSILMYPGAYIVSQPTVNGPYIVEERQEARLGESWIRDQVILSWAHIQSDLRHWNDGHNLILHEFAHQLDQEDDQAEGVPILKHQADYAQWTQVMATEYEQLCEAVRQRRKTVLDSYGTKNPAEFFAVATETFFEKSKQLKKSHPALYEQLKRYYQLDPAIY